MDHQICWRPLRPDALCWREWDDEFVVYNDERNTRTRGFPELTTRAFIVKVNRLLRF